MTGSRASFAACAVVGAVSAALAVYFQAVLNPDRTPLPVIVVLVGGATLMAVAAFAALRASVETRLNVLLVAGSGMVALYFLEIALLAFQPLRLAVGEFVGTEDSRSKVQVIRDLRSGGRDAFSNFLPTLHARSPKVAAGEETALVPLGSVSRAIAVTCNEGGRWLAFEADEHGFNNPAGLWPTARQAPVDILALGDSFTEGDCVPPAMNILGWLRAAYPRTLNLGVMGNGPLLQLAGLAEYGPVARPRTILWFFFEGNDLVDLQSELAAPFLRRYLDSDFRQDLPARQDEVDALLRPLLERALSDAEAREAPRPLMRSIADALLLRHLRHALRADRVVSAEMMQEESMALAGIGDLVRVLRRARTVAEGWNGRIVLVYLPGWTSVARPERPSELRAAVLSAVRELGLPVVDPHAAFLAQPDPGRAFFRFPGSHYNEAGYRLVAEAIRAAGVLPPPAPR